ncbi:MAG: arylsulfotransferase family protein [Solirubrobacteraceae bacterium]
MNRPVTRRQLLRLGGVGAAGLGLSGSAAEWLTGALASRSPYPPKPPRWHTRPDLRIPALTILRSRQGVSEDPIFIAPYNNPHGQQGAVIATNAGEPIWENPISNKVTTNFQVQRYRGSPVLTWWEGSIELGHGVGEYVIADSAYRTVRRVQARAGLRGDLHEFVITPRDTALLTSYVVREADLSAVGGPRKGTIQDAIFQEIDLAGGRLLMEWHSLDHVSPHESYAPVSEDWDYFHINSVDTDGDGLLVSARSTHTIYRLDRSGQIAWRLGGKYSDFAMGQGASFAWQHHARRRPGGTLSVFDNGATPAVEKLSRGLILQVDEDALAATLAREYTHPKILSGSQGSVQMLDNGNVFVGFGEAPHVCEFRRSGELLFDAVLGSQYESYRAFRLPWRGLPAEAPAIATSGGGPALTVYASWNGATDVDSWLLLAGSTPDELAPDARVRARGFENSLRPAAAGPHFAVRALDATGTTLGQSPTVTV